MTISKLDVLEGTMFSCLLTTFESGYIFVISEGLGTHTSASLTWRSSIHLVPCHHSNNLSTEQGNNPEQSGNISEKYALDTWPVYWHELPPICDNYFMAPRPSPSLRHKESKRVGGVGSQFDMDAKSKPLSGVVRERAKARYIAKTLAITKARTDAKPKTKRRQTTYAIRLKKTAIDFGVMVGEPSSPKPNPYLVSKEKSQDVLKRAGILTEAGDLSPLFK